ncbi:hypothetical protein ACFX2I_029804 [Malus domestica]
MKNFSVGGGNKAICSCGEGWKYAITKTDGPDAGKAYYNCGESCTCLMYASHHHHICRGGDVMVKEQEKLGPSEAYCECGEAWSCVVTKLKTQMLERPSLNVLMVAPL